MNIEKRSSEIEGKLETENHRASDFEKGKDSNVTDDEIDLLEIWNAIWNGKLFIVLFTAFFSVGGILYALSLPNVYKASTLLTSASNNGSGGLNNLVGQYGGLASLAGINLGGGGNDKTVLALKVLNSRLFIENFIEKNNLLVPLMAFERWDQGTGQLVIDSEKYDIEQQTWIDKSDDSKPSEWAAYKKFQEILTVDLDKESGMITLSIEYISPELAKKWITLLVKELNITMQDKDKKEAQDSIEYLSSKLKETQLSDMRSVFYKLIEEQTKTIMLAEVSDEYIFKTIDPSNVPDEKHGPARAIIVVLVSMLGGMLSTLIVLGRYFKNRN